MEGKGKGRMPWEPTHVGSSGLGSDGLHASATVSQPTSGLPRFCESCMDRFIEPDGSTQPRVGRCQGHEAEET